MPVSNANLNALLSHDECKFLLYIDILGFSDLVTHGGAVDDLYLTIDNLTVHDHQHFNTIVFSDTILVYNNVPPADTSKYRIAIMYMCEFAQDLFYRCRSEIAFRAYLTFGSFKHYKLKNLEAFYGESLVTAYKKEKELQCVGLFIDSRLVSYCEHFRVDQYDDSCHFVHLIQNFEDINFDESEYPFDPLLVRADGIYKEIADDFAYMKKLHALSNDASLSMTIRIKYITAWHIIRNRHRGLISVLEKSDFNPMSISRFNWSSDAAAL